MSYQARRFHDFSYGHRVLGHGGKCAMSHGHNGRVHFICEAEELDSVGRVIDFSVIKSLLAEWLEKSWDHKFLLYENDPWIAHFKEFDPNGLVVVPFNPTAENIAKYLVEVIGPQQLQGTGVKLVECIVEETSKCSASYSIEG
jgi:6-pyruvoyltetrahydropterin/6-carboxytetrahydropterin synthase